MIERTFDILPGEFMARMVDTWPEKRRVPEPTMSYPWKTWTNGQIWIADQGIDFPASSNFGNFRHVLYSTAARISRSRQRKLDKKVEELRAQGKTVRRLPVAVKLKVKIQMVSDTQVAFQFFDEDNPPAAVERAVTATPTMRRAQAPAATARPTDGPSTLTVQRKKRKAHV